MTPSPTDDPKTLVSTDWLARHQKDPDLRVLDASWHMPDTGRDGRAEYDAAHIPGARFFDIDDISDQRSALPHMAPPVEKFMSRMRAMGVGDGFERIAPAAQEEAPCRDVEEGAGTSGPGLPDDPAEEVLLLAVETS